MTTYQARMTSRPWTRASRTPMRQVPMTQWSRQPGGPVGAVRNASGEYPFVAVSSTRSVPPRAVPGPGLSVQHVGGRDLWTRFDLSGRFFFVPHSYVASSLVAYSASG